MNKIWQDGDSWKYWFNNEWVDGSQISNEEKINYLTKQLSQVTAIADAYTNIEELAMDYITEASANDKWKWKFKDALKHLNDF